MDFVNPKLKILIGRTPTRSIIKDWRRRNLKSISEIAAYIDDNEYDIVHFNGFSGFQLYFHWFLRRIPKVYTIHDYLPHLGEWRATPVIFNRLYTKLNYHFIQHHQILSKKFSEFYNVQPEKIHAVYCGPYEIYRVFEDKTVREEANTILFFGRISPYKGIEFLVEAFFKIKKKLPNTRLIIAGQGNFWFDIKGSEGLEFHNRYLPNEELVSLIQRASIVVAPYTDATHSGVIMTAYAFNKPVVASAVGGIPEVVEDNVTGRLVKPKDTQALANAIIDLLSNKEKILQIKNNIERQCSVGKFSWDDSARRTTEIYEQAIREHRA